MQNKNSEHLVVVQNPNSTRAARIDERVFDPLDAQGITYDVYHTKHADAEDNIDAMRQDIPAGATVVTAAGDGTAMQLANASLRGDKGWTLGFMPLGNFNDHANTHAQRQHSVLELLDAPTIEMKPLTIEVDGEYWRHAPLYMTIGWSALAASQFGDSESRDAMKNTPAALKLAKSLGQLAGNYFQNRRTTLPPFEANGVYHKNMTDIMAVNGPRVAGVIRSQDTYFDKPYFGAKTDIDVSYILPNIPFGLQAIAGYTPLDHVESMRIIFEEATKIPVQTEGEFEWLTASEIFVYKNPADAINVLHSKALAGERS
jgi:hypothetical protein